MTVSGFPTSTSEPSRTRRDASRPRTAAAAGLLVNGLQKATDQMLRTAKWIGLAVSVAVFVSVATVRADEWDKKSTLTFSQPFEVPGAILPAGTYIFKLADTLGDRHIVQIFNADGLRLLATTMTIPDYRLKTTTETVVRFNEATRGTPQAIQVATRPAIAARAMSTPVRRSTTFTRPPGLGCGLSRRGRTSRTGRHRRGRPRPRTASTSRRTRVGPWP